MTDTTPGLNGAGANYFSIDSVNNQGIISVKLPLYSDNSDTQIYTVSVGTENRIPNDQRLL